VELAVATKEARTGTRTRTRTRAQARTRSALTVALWQLLLLIALAYGIAYLVPACFNFASGQPSEEARSNGLVHGSGIELHAELVCQSAPPRLWERSACNLPK
jgi:hypothetical protein